MFAQSIRWVGEKKIRHTADGTRRTWSYDVLQVTYYDEEDNDLGAAHVGTPRVVFYDGRGREIEVQETHIHMDVDPGTHSTLYQYAHDGQLTSVTNANSEEIYTATYDSRGRPVAIHDASRGDSSFVYDDLDRIISTMDARGEMIDYAYDAAGRIETVTSTDGVTTFYYDVDSSGGGLTMSCNLPGRLASVDGPINQTTYCYDQRGRVTHEGVIVHALGALEYATEQAWDSLDRRTNILYPDGTQLSQTYGENGRVEEVSVDGIHATQQIVSHVQYTPWGAPRRIQLANGAELVYRYDGRMRPKANNVQHNGSWLQQLQLTLDNVGNVTAVTDAISYGSADYQYDDLYRLVQASGDRYGGEVATYEYDRLGNLLYKGFSDAGSSLHIGTLTYGHATNPNAVTAALGDTFVYDNAGNLIEDGTHEFDYTPDGSLRTAFPAGTGGISPPLIELHYDHTGRRIGKTGSSGNSVYYFPEAELRTIGGVDTWVKHVVVGGRTVARFEDTFSAADVSDHVFFYADDHLGSPTLVLDMAGAIVERYYSHPWGEENTYPLEAQDAANGTTDFMDSYYAAGDPASKLERRFQGREIDGEVGLYNFDARLYHPRLGRFMTPDSIVPQRLNSQNWNRYAFVRNNPVAFIDPTGHAETSVTVTQNDPTVQHWYKAMLSDVGDVEEGFKINGLDPVLQFAMNYVTDRRTEGNEFGAVGYQATRITTEESFNMSASLDAILQVSGGVSSKQIIEGYHFTYSFTNADGEFVTKSLTLDSGKRGFTNEANASFGVGVKGSYQGAQGGFSASAGGSMTQTGYYRSANDNYVSTFVTEWANEAGGSRYFGQRYKPDSAHITTDHSEQRFGGYSKPPQRDASPGVGVPIIGGVPMFIFLLSGH